MDQHNPYAAPQVALVEESSPAELPGWTPRQLRLLAWVNLASLLGTLAMLVLGFIPGEEGKQYPDWLSAVLMLVGCYVLLRFRNFAELRFAARGLAWPIWLSVGLSLLLEVLQLLWGDEVLASISGKSLAYFGLIGLYGAITLWLGIRLLKVDNVYPSFRVLAWLEIAGGALLASVILFIVGMLPLLGSMLAMSLVFLRGARELEDNRRV
ncbi:hypothetical protein [Aquipseudomonas ullengensis]|uniref:Uncharacterized protein n=1 Tax=Aquipseudomonas ullengensis TaxID=2759166 RepID=A0A7W4LN47_9GAMM|nr:hypothetical protein [Pseudomonas ullengensis]MBB2496236.1 hypothetical protein [Pseudomonas ullengensis]